MGWLFNQVANLILKMAVAGLNGIADLFVGVMTLRGKETLDLFWQMFLPSAQNSGGANGFMVMIALGLFLLYMIFLFQLVKSFLGPLSSAESPFKLIARAGIFSILVVYSADLCGWFMDVATAPFNVIADDDGGYIDYGATVGLGDKIEDMATQVSQSTTDQASEGETEEKKGLLSKIWDGLKKMFETVVFGFITSIFGFFIVFSILFNYLKLIIEIAERYIVLGALCLFSPMIIATGVSETTSGTFKSWFKVMVSQMILIIIGLFFIRTFQAAVGRLSQLATSGMKLNNGANYHPIIGLVFLLSWLRVGQRVDNYMGTLGLTAIAAGDGLLGDIIAGGALAKKAGKAAAGLGAGAIGLGSSMKNRFKGTEGNVLKKAGAAATKGIGDHLKSEGFKKRHPNIAKFGRAAGNLIPGWAKKDKDSKSAKEDTKMNYENNNKQGFATTGKEAKDVAKDVFGDTKIDGTDKTVNDLLNEGYTIKDAEFDKDGGNATLKDEAGREVQVGFGRGENEKDENGKEIPGTAKMSAGIIAANPETSIAGGGEIAPEGTESNAQDTLKNANEENAEKIENGGKEGENETTLTKDADGNLKKADAVDAPNPENEDAAQTGLGNAKAEASVENSMQDGAANGTAVNTEGKQESVTGKVDGSGNVINPARDVKKDEKGQTYIEGNRGGKVPVAKFGNGYKVDGFQQAMRSAKKPKAMGLDNKAHDISHLMKGGKLDKSQVNEDANGNKYYTSKGGAIIPANQNGDIESVQNGISQSGLALNKEGGLTNISGSLGDDGMIDKSKAVDNGDGTFSVSGADGSSVAVNMSTGGVAGLTADMTTMTSAKGSDGKMHDVSNYLDSSGNVNQALLKGEAGSKYLDLGNDVHIATNDDGSFKNPGDVQTSQELSMAGLGDDGKMHDLTGSIDASTGLVKQSAIQTDSGGSFVTANDGTRVAVDSQGAVGVSATKSGATAAVIDNSGKGSTETVSKAALAVGGFALGAMAFSGGGKGRMRSDSGASLGASYSYASTAPTYNVPNNSSSYVASSAIIPSTGTISPSAVTTVGGQLVAPGINGGYVPVANHGGGVYTALPGGGYNPSGTGSAHAVALDISPDSSLIAKSYTTNTSLASGFSRSSGSLGTHVQLDGGGYGRLAPAGMTADGSGIQRFDSTGSANNKGQYTYVIGENGETQFKKITGSATYNQSSYTGDISIKTANSGPGQYRTIHESGRSEYGGITRYNSKNEIDPAGDYVRCTSTGGTGYDLVRADVSNGELSTYETSYSIGGASLTKNSKGQFLMDVGPNATIVSNGNGTSSFRNGETSFEMTKAVYLGKDSVDYPQVTGTDGTKYCLVPNTQLRFNGEVKDFSDSLRGTMAAKVAFGGKKLGTGQFSSVKQSSINRSFGKNRSGDAYYVKDGSSYRAATRAETQDSSIQKFTQQSVLPNENVQSVFNLEGKQDVKEMSAASRIDYAYNGENGTVFFANKDAKTVVKDGKELTQGYAIIPAGEGLYGHTKIEGFDHKGQEPKLFEKGGQAYYLATVLMDKNHNVVSGLECFKEPDSSNGVFSSKVSKSIKKARIPTIRNVKARDRDSDLYFRRK